MKKRKLIFCLISFLTVSFYANAQFSGSGNGTEDNPYQITTAAQLNEMHSYEGVAGNGIHFKLMNDIDVAALITQEYAELGWKPVGSDNDANAFSGYLHGGSFTIKNLWIARGTTDYVGLFGYIKNGGIDHLTIETDATHSIAGGNYVGGLSGGVETASVTFCDIKGKISGASYVGGLIGAVNQDVIIQNNSATTITVIATSGYVGGLIGQTASAVSDCISSGTVSLNGDNSGGLIGFSSAAVSNSSSSVNIKNTGNILVGNFMGGLVGVAQSTVTSCNATGTVTGTNVIGGLVGDSYALISDSYATGVVTGNAHVGGLIGGSDAVTNCYATGNVIGDQDYVGGLAGQAYGNIDTCYATGAVTGAKTIGGLAGAANGTVIHSFASGDVTEIIPQNVPEGGFIDIGGLIGNAGLAVTDCYATGNVYGVLNCMYVGGLIGLSGDVVSNCYASGSVITEGYSLIGGLIGSAWAPVSNCVAANPAVTGSLQGNLAKINRVAGLTEFDGTIASCYALDSMRINGALITNGAADNLEGLNKTVGELQKQSTYDVDQAWDFNEIWTIREGHGYPYFGSKDYLTSIISASVNDTTQGAIAVFGDIAVEDGTSITFTITPKIGYVIDSVLVDGENVGTEPTYTFTNVLANHTIQAVFKQGELGTDDNAILPVTAYPNPVNTILNLSTELNISSVEVYSMYGQKIMSQGYDANQIALNMSQLSSGTYLVRVMSNDKVKTIKIIKQ